MANAHAHRHRVQGRPCMKGSECAQCKANNTQRKRMGLPLLKNSTSKGRHVPRTRRQRKNRTVTKSV